MSLADRFPVEVLEQVLDNFRFRFVLVGRDNPAVKTVFIPTLAACALTCRLWSDIARPRLFNSIRLDQPEERVVCLLSLIRANASLSFWIKDVRIMSQSDGFTNMHRRPRRKMWLGLATGRALMRELQSVDSLALVETELGDYHNYNASDLRHEQVRLEVAQAWANLAILKKVETLSVLWSQVPSWDVLIIALTQHFPALRHATLRAVETPFTVDPPPDGLLDKDFTIPHLNTLCVDSINHNIVFLLIGRMICPALTSLRLGLGDYSNRAPDFARSLFTSARGLHTLVLDEVATGVHSLDLSSCTELQHLIFNDVGDMDYPALMSGTIASLPAPSQISHLEIAGYLGYVQDESWSAIDDALRASQFQPSANFTREVLLKHTKHDLDKDDGTDDADNKMINETTKPILLVTQRCGWFRITWPKP